MTRSKKWFFVIFLVTILSAPLLSQDPAKKEFTRAIQEADISFYYDKDYGKAAGLYESILPSSPENASLSAKLGMCCLNLDGRKQDALKLLKMAATNVAADTREYDDLDTKAPPDTWFYLAVAYHRNDSLEKALSIFYDLRKKAAAEDPERADYIDLQIRDCRYAMEMKKKPLTIVSEFFAPWLINYPGACNPVLAKNDSVFIFTQQVDGKCKVFCSFKIMKEWAPPSDITGQLGGLDRYHSNSITGDGKILIIGLDDGNDGNLYFSERTDTSWSRIKSLGRPVNTIYWESHGFITPEGNSIYISSNRPGGAGELDIWRSDKKDDGSWSEPLNLGDVINTHLDEDYPFFDPANNALLFCSKGHISMGGYDVFRSTQRGGGWTNPIGMPYAFNNTSENIFFILNNNAPGFVASRYDEEKGSRNIFTIVAIDPADEITTAEGRVRLGDGMEPDPGKINVRLTDAKKKIISESIPVNSDGTFRFEIKPGDYELFISHPGYVTDTLGVNLPLYFLSHYMVLTSNLVPEEVASGTFLDIRNILFGFDHYDLDDEAKKELEALKSILLNYPELKIEVAGYTDAKGSTEYNRKLADRRAQAVIDYMTDRTIPSSRFVKKAFGESDFTAVNANRDGTDNPEGRKYNRRVTFGIIDNQTGVVIRHDTYTPEHLRLTSSMRYSIVLKKSASKLSASVFNNIHTNGLLFIRTIPTDSEYYYVLGLFYNKSDAVKYLNYVHGKGFSEAYLANHYDLNYIVNGNGPGPAVVSKATGKKTYTIQLKAVRSPLNPDYFRKYKGVQEIPGADGFFRYITGEYTDYDKARDALDYFIKEGIEDAFIRELNLLITK